MSSDRPVIKIRIPRTVWVLGFVSLLMDISSEMIHALLPLFMPGTLGASAIWIGLVEGIGEATALIAKVFSGVVADRFGHKKRLVLPGTFWVLSRNQSLLWPVACQLFLPLAFSIVSAKA